MNWRLILRTSIIQNNIVRDLCQSCKIAHSTSFPDIDINYYCNQNNISEIKKNIIMRKSAGDINSAIDIFNLMKSKSLSDNSYNLLKHKLYNILAALPNKTHPLVLDYEDNPHLVQTINKKRDFGSFQPLEFSEITRRLNLMRTDKLGYTCGHKSYYFLDQLAELEEALIKYTISFVTSRQFNLVSVPDILPRNILESCGMSVNSDRTQIYSLDAIHHGPDLYLSGTAEMSLAGLLMNTTHQKNNLPLKLAAVSRCYRAETSNVIEERGIYRVHQFSKVEMFVISTPEESATMHELIRQTQEELFSALDLHMRVLDMPPHELGAPAYRKYDIEAWMPGRNNFGEISSCSNCTDFQSRRLNIKFINGDLCEYVHTLNGTACAVPRMMIALLETHQDPKGRITIPNALKPFICGKEFIGKNTHVPELKLNKMKK